MLQITVAVKGGITIVDWVGECQGCMNLPVTTQQRWAIEGSSGEDSNKDDASYSDDDVESPDNLKTEMVTDEFLFEDSCCYLTCT